MATPEGIRRRALRIRHRTYARTEPSIFFEPEHHSAGDTIFEMDTAHVRSLSRNVEIKKSVRIRVGASPSHGRHTLTVPRASVVPPRARNRLPEQFIPEEITFGSGPDPSVFGNAAHGLVLDQYDPYWVTDQFTHREFITCYRRVYGPMERVHAACRAMAAGFASAFHRIERVEARIGGEVKEIVNYVDLPRLQPIRAVGGFLALALAVTLPANALIAYRSASYAKNAAESAGQDALRELLAVASADDAGGIRTSLKRASDRFHEADALLADSGAMAAGLAAVVPARYRAARALLEVGNKTADAGRLLARGVEKMFEDPVRRLSERFDLLAAYADGVLPLVDDAVAAADSIDPDDLPADMRDRFARMRLGLDDARSSFEEMAMLSERLSVFLGKDRTRTYLLVFQNHTELRPTGGFMGSVAEVTVDRGDVKKVTVPPGGTYDLQGQLREYVAAPKPIRLINARWEFQDSNWSPDFPTAAGKMNWFWSRSGQPTLDGIVAVNASFVERVLEVTGPVEVPEYGTVIHAGNFIEETQRRVEVAYDHEANTPKKFVGDLGLALMARMKSLSKDEWLRVAVLFSEAMATKDVQVYFTDRDEEAFAESMGWNGRMKSTEGDALALIEANIAGQKTDGVIEERVTHLAEIAPDGGIQDTVTLVRRHTGQKGDLFSGVRNVSYLRAYVPAGSRLISAEGFERPPAELFDTPEPYFTKDAAIEAVEATMTTHPSGMDIMLEGTRTVFGGWLQLDPGEEQTITFKYTLPFTIHDVTRRLSKNGSAASARPDERAYFLLLTSQSGKADRHLTSEIRYPDAWSMGWSRGVIPRAGSAVFEGAWDRDHVSAGLFTVPAYE